MKKLKGSYKDSFLNDITLGDCIRMKREKLGISQISKERIKNVEDVLHIGDKVTVRVTEIDDQGRINLTMKDLIEPKTEE